MHKVYVWAPRPRFSVHVFYFFFFFFLPTFVDFGRQYLLLWTVYILFTHCAYTVHVLKKLKMGLTILFTHLKIILLQYFQFSVFSNNKFNPNTPKSGVHMKEPFASAAYILSSSNRKTSIDARRLDPSPIKLIFIMPQISLIKTSYNASNLTSLKGCIAMQETNKII